MHLYKPDDYDKQWRCAYCGQWFVIPDLARKHEPRCEMRPV